MKRGLLKNRKAMEIEILGWWGIALGVLVTTIVGYLIISGKLSGALEYIKNLLRFGR